MIGGARSSDGGRAPRLFRCVLTHHGFAAKPSRQIGPAVDDGTVQDQAQRDTKSVTIVTGFLLGAAALGFAISRQLSGERLLKVLDEYPRGRAVHRALLAGSAARTLLVVTLLRVPPNGPFAMTNLLLAATGVSWGPYLLGSLIGLAPRVAAAVVVGASLSTLDLRHLERGGPAYVTIGLSVAAVIALGWIANRGLRRLST